MSQMLHTKPQGHWPFASGEEDLFNLPYMGMVAILIMWSGCGKQTLIPQAHWGSIWDCFDWTSGFWEDIIWRVWVFLMRVYAKHVIPGPGLFLTPGL